jgi:peptidoglycan/LPS O-acetylase OafA/YrhL
MLIVAGTLPSVADSTQLGTAAWSWTPVVLGCFLVGGLLARHRRALLSASDGLPRRRRRSLGLLVLISFWLPSFLRHGALACAVGNLVPVAGAALLLIVAQGTGMRRVLTAGPVAWLGAVSFPLYAFHIIVLHLLLGTSPLDVAPVAYAVLGLPLAIAIAWLIHRWVEVPLAAAPLSVGRGGAALHSATA